ncbi:Uncharacterised protein [Klebsiella pneumoniae]|uniref:T6SS Phospholipase effector Tle1-like C-terminal domain-containing protein n=1 Tax=Klebsiella pneumoniae TaxID=573 RepID=A0A447RJ21_KLEPN|nr:Uncharacterised protein [Klebsiella pneumoniae]
MIRCMTHAPGLCMPALGTREMWTGYFRYRMIYFSERCSKPLSPLVLAGDLVGLRPVTAGVVLSFRQKRLTGQAGRAGCDRRRALAGGGGAGPDKPGKRCRSCPEGSSCGHLPRAGNRCRTAKGAKADEQLARGQAALPASWLEDVLTTTV